MATKTLLGAFLRGKCPHCREGDIFTHSVFKLSRYYGMHEYCPHCGTRLIPEPGFYQGAMYVSYGFTVATLATVSLVLHVAGNPSELTYILSIIACAVLLAPLNYRYSRITYLYLFGGITHASQKE